MELTGPWSLRASGRGIGGGQALPAFPGIEIIGAAMPNIAYPLDRSAYSQPGPLTCMFQWAVKHRIITRNPLELWSKRKEAPKDFKLTHEDVKKIIAVPACPHCDRRIPTPLRLANEKALNSRNGSSVCGQIPGHHPRKYWSPADDHL